MLYFSFGARQCMQMQHLNSYRQRLVLGQKSCIIGFICNFYNIFLHTATVAMNCTLSRKNSIIHEHFYSKTNRICLFLDEAVRHGSGPLLTPPVGCRPVPPKLYSFLCFYSIGNIIVCYSSYFCSAIFLKDIP